MHVRQVVLVAHDLEPVVDDLCAVFDLDVAFRDPGVAEFGLRNAVLPVGTTFLEVVSPVREDAAAARFLRRHGGGGGYMAILQTANLEADRRRLVALGVRIVWQATLEDIATIHLHPRDVGAAIVSIDEPTPAASWRWGGPGWPAKVRTGVVHGIAGMSVEASEPGRLAARWAEVLGLRAPTELEGDRFEVRLDEGEIAFVRAHERGDGIAAVRLAAADPARARAAARARGLRAQENSTWIGGVRFDLT